MLILIRHEDNTLNLVANTTVITLPTHWFEELDVGEVAKINKVVSQEDLERLRFIKENLVTRDKWALSDYKDFYERDIQFVLGLLL